MPLVQLNYLVWTNCCIIGYIFQPCCTTLWCSWFQTAQARISRSQRRAGRTRTRCRATPGRWPGWRGASRSTDLGGRERHSSAGHQLFMQCWALSVLCRSIWRGHFVDVSLQCIFRVSGTRAWECFIVAFCHYSESHTWSLCTHWPYRTLQIFRQRSREMRQVVRREPMPNRKPCIPYHKQPASPNTQAWHRLARGGRGVKHHEIKFFQARINGFL